MDRTLDWYLGDLGSILRSAISFHSGTEQVTLCLGSPSTKCKQMILSPYNSVRGNNPPRMKCSGALELQELMWLENQSDLRYITTMGAGGSFPHGGLHGTD